MAGDAQGNEEIRVAPVTHLLGIVVSSREVGVRAV